MEIRPRMNLRLCHVYHKPGMTAMNFVQQNDPKAEEASVKIWDLLVQNLPKDSKHQMNYKQFKICLLDNRIRVDPDMSVDLFYELIRMWDIIEHNRVEIKKQQYKQAPSGVTAEQEPQLSQQTAVTKREEEIASDPPQKDNIAIISWCQFELRFECLST
eukprot:43436_1